MNRNKILILLFLAFPCFAQEETYFLPGRGQSFEMENSKDERATYFIPNKTPEEQMTSDEESILYFLPGSGKDSPMTDKDYNKDETFIAKPNPSEIPEFSVGNLEDEKVGQLPAGSAGNQKSEFDNMDNMEKLNKLRDKANNLISLSILYDNFNYGGQSGVYDQLFEGSNSSVINNMFFQLAYDITFIRKYILLSGGLNLGASFKSGNGTFSDGQKSDTTISLWAIPLDLSLTLQIPLGSLFRLEAEAGPSLMTLLQNRDDRNQGESGKDLYQLSPGYFVGGKFKINWGNIWKSSALALFNTTDVTNFFLSFDVRYETYNKFSDEYVKVDGISYGLGLSFEFL